MKDNPKPALNLVSMMLQFYAPLSGVTLAQSIESILYIRGVTGKEAKLQTEKIIADLDITRWKKYAGDKLSGGLQRLTHLQWPLHHPRQLYYLTSRLMMLILYDVNLYGSI